LNCEISQFWSGSRFLDFPRNRLAAYEQPPGGICDFDFFWVFSVNGLAAEHEPPGGTSIMTLFFGCGVLDVFYDAP